MGYFLIRRGTVRFWRRTLLHRVSQLAWQSVNWHIKATFIQVQRKNPGIYEPVNPFVSQKMSRKVTFIIITSNLSNDRSKASSKTIPHIVRSTASSFNWQYPLLSLRSSSSFLRLLPRLLVTSICPSIFPSITCCRRQFLRKMWPIQLAFRFLISCRILTL